MDPIQPTTPPVINQPEPQEHIFNKILKFTLILLILVSIGLGGFLFLQMKNVQNPSTVTKTGLTISPAAVSPTIAVSEDPNDVNIGSVEADLKDIETDLKGLE